MFGRWRPAATTSNDGTVILGPRDNVFSYLMFSRPIAQVKSSGKACSSQDVLSWLLLGLVMFMQTTILYAISQDIVDGEEIWRREILNPNVLSSETECNPGDSLCVLRNNSFHCAPPSVELVSHWEELDLNNDGIWGIEEANSSRTSLRCKYAVDPLEVFKHFTSFVKTYDLPFLHPLLKSGKGLHKSYFELVKGDIIMCVYGYEALCPNLLSRGFFDVPLKTGVSKSLGKSIDSTLAYCKELMKSDGLCERNLPVTYSVWRIGSEKQCKEPLFKDMVYKHPVTGMTESLLEVDYQAVVEYAQGAQSPLFLVFKCITLTLFFLAIFPEFKIVFVIFTWVWTVPREEDVDEAVKVIYDEERNRERFVIQGITMIHRVMVFCMTVARLLACSYLGYVGCIFLCSLNVYLDLLMNSIGLVFVLEISSALYSQVLSDDLRDTFENIEPFEVQMGSWKVLWIPNAAVRDLLGLFFVIGVVCLSMFLYHNSAAQPIATALECTCLATGDHCHEAQVFNKDFWTKYWSQEVPQAWASIEKELQGANETDSFLDEVGKKTPDVNHGLAEVKIHAKKGSDVLAKMKAMKGNAFADFEAQVLASLQTLTKELQDSNETDSPLEEMKQENPGFNHFLAQVEFHAKNESGALAKTESTNGKAMGDFEAQAKKTAVKGGQQTIQMLEKQEQPSSHNLLVREAGKTSFPNASEGSRNKLTHTLEK